MENENDYAIGVEELKPCPFCGAIPHTENVYANYAIIKHSDTCFLKLIGHKGVMRREFKQWNTRSLELAEGGAEQVLRRFWESLTEEVE